MVDVMKILDAKQSAKDKILDGIDRFNAVLYATDKFDLSKEESGILENELKRGIV